MTYLVFLLLIPFSSDNSNLIIFRLLLSFIFLASISKIEILSNSSPTDISDIVSINTPS